MEHQRENVFDSLDESIKTILLKIKNFFGDTQWLWTPENVDVRMGDALVYPFESSSFDAAISLFGVMFFNDLTAFMSSGPAVVICLEADGAIAKWRAVMGATNPENAEEGTLRKLFATNIERNAVHGSDAPETARIEISYFFNASEIQALVEALP